MEFISNSMKLFYMYWFLNFFNRIDVREEVERGTLTLWMKKKIRICPFVPDFQPCWQGFHAAFPLNTDIACLLLLFRSPVPLNLVLVLLEALASLPLEPSWLTHMYCSYDCKNPEANLVVQDFTISKHGSSCNHLLFCLILAPCLHLSIRFYSILFNTRQDGMPRI